MSNAETLRPAGSTGSTNQEPLIVYSPVPPDDVLAIARQFLPEGFRFELVDAAGLPAAVREADYVMGFLGPLADDVITQAPHLKLFQLMSVGYDTFNLTAARAARIPVSVNGGANAIAVAEHAIMLMLAALRRLTELDAQVRAGTWMRGPNGAPAPRIYEIWHSTVGIVGMGRIGQEVAMRLQNWSARLVYYDPIRLPAEREQALGVTYLPLEELLAEADAVTIHVPLNDATRHLINGTALARMKPSAVLVNTARGGLVDEEALAQALLSGQIAAAGLDVLSQEPASADHPLLSLPNTILTPHLAGPTWQSWPRRFENCFANIARVQRGEPAQWVVPELADLFPR